MTHSDRSIRLARWVALALLGAALLGPWSYDLINVPAEYSCESPYLRLIDDYCGLPYSGAAVVWGVVHGALFGAGEGLSVQGEVPDWMARMLMASAALLILAPMLLVALEAGMRRGVARSWLTPAILVGSLLPLALLLPYARTLPPQVLWGFWLYLTIAGGLSVLEGYKTWNGRPRRAAA